MAASVRVEDEAFADRRYHRLAKLAGLADDDHARGKMLVLWRQCTIENQEVLPLVDVLDVLGSNGVTALEGAGLGEDMGNGTVRIRGTAGRIEWLQKLRENGKKGGRPRKDANNQKVIESKPIGIETNNPPAPAPAPAPAPVKKVEREGGHKAEALALSVRAVKTLNDLTGCRFDHSAKPTMADATKLAKAGHTPDQAEAVVRAKYREWAGDTNMSKQLKPSVLLRPSNFAKYLAEDVVAGPAQRELIPTTDDADYFAHIDSQVTP